MKKSNIIIAAGCFIVVTALLCINPDGKTYEKQKHFTTTSEVMNELENNPITVRDERGYRKETDAFKECISKRKRMTEAQFYFKDMSIKEVVNLTEKQKEALIYDYNSCRKNLSKGTEVKDIQVERVIAEVYRYYYTETDENKEELQLDFVFVDEGQGLVIDYITQMPVEKTDEEKGDLNVEG